MTNVSIRIEPLFSIVTVTLNAGEKLEHTVASVKAQSFRDFEHVVKDAGSTDNSIQRYAMPSPGYSPIVICKPDRGIYDAMNQALETVHGKYVLFLNAGDTFYDQTVLSQLAPLCAGAGAAELVYTDYAVEGGRSRVRNPSKMSRFSLFRTTLCHQACFIMRDCYSELGNFNSTLRVFGDYDFLLRLILRPQARYRYVPMISTTFLGGGVSSDPALFGLMRREVTGLRQKYFSGWEGRAFGLLHASTFPWLRIGIMRTPKLRPLAAMYRHGLNLWRRWRNNVG